MGLKQKRFEIDSSNYCQMVYFCGCWNLFFMIKGIRYASVKRYSDSEYLSGFEAATKYLLAIYAFSKFYGTSKDIVSVFMSRNIA